MNVNNIISFKIMINDTIELAERREASNAHPNNEIFIGEIRDGTDTESISRRIFELILDIRRPSNALFAEINEAISVAQIERIIEHGVGNKTARQEEISRVVGLATVDGNERRTVGKRRAGSGRITTQLSVILGLGVAVQEKM